HRPRTGREQRDCRKTCPRARARQNRPRHCYSPPHARRLPAQTRALTAWIRQYDDVKRTSYQRAGNPMHRVTITVDDNTAAELDRFMEARGYANRSEAIRDLARGGLEQRATEVADDGACVAALVYVYDHHARDLPKRLTQGFHEHHEIAQ